MVTIPIWAAVAAVAVIVVVAGGITVARIGGRVARPVIGPWIIDRRPQTPSPPRATVVDRGDGRSVPTSAPPLVIPAARYEHREEER